MSIFSATILVAATVYVRADDAEAAKGIIRGLSGNGLEVKDAGGDVEISGLQFDDPDLPDVSFSPAMTVQPVSDEDMESLECSHDDDDFVVASAAGYQVVENDNGADTDPFTVLDPQGESLSFHATEDSAWAAARAASAPTQEDEDEDVGDTKGWEVGDRCDVPTEADRGEIISFMSTPAENGFAIAVIKLDFGGANNAIVNVDKLDILYDEPDAARPY